MTLANAANAMRWGNEPPLQEWLSRARLNIFREHLGFAKSGIGCGPLFRALFRISGILFKAH